MLFELAWRSLLHRRVSVLLTLISMLVSVFIVISIQHIRTQAEASFYRTVDGVDLLVGARTSPINLLLYAVFRIGNATTNISYDSYQRLADHPRVAWTIPLSLGDSHRGYRVVGTNEDYFRHYRHGGGNLLSFAAGAPFTGVFEAVIGSEVARQLDYRVGDPIVLAHGVGAVSFVNHDNMPFTITGILDPTGTPVDQSIHVSLEGIEAIHLGWQNGMPVPGRGPSAEAVIERAAELQPTQITAFLLGLNSRIDVFGMQREINTDRSEPMSAVLPGVALAELWQTVSIVERLLTAIALLVLFASLLGLATMMLSSIRERRREIALYRAIGAHASLVYLLVELEALGIALAACVLGYLSVVAGAWLFRDLLAGYGLYVTLWPTGSTVWIYLGVVLVSTGLLALIPASLAYVRSLEVR